MPGPFVYLGTDDYDQLGEAYKKVITILRLEPDGLTLAPAGECLDLCVGANYLRASGGFLYACDGMACDIVALSMDSYTGALALVNRQSCRGVHDVPCFLDFSKDGRWCLTAAYCDGTVAVWPINPDDGSLGECTDTKKQSGEYNPALSDRQETAHAHQVLLDSTDRWA